jgi:two-component sensor histidine kinase
MRKNIRTSGEGELAKTRALVFQREREFVELNHRVANNLQIAATYLTLSARRLRDEDVKDAKDALAAVGARIAAISRFHRYLYRHGAFEPVNLKDFLEDIGPDIALGAGVSCTVHAEPIGISSDMAQQLAIAVNEFAINAGKHAYGGAGDGAIDIGCWRNEDARLRLTVSDRGEGLPAGFDIAHATGIGLAIVVQIARQLGAELVATNDHGARFTLLVPVSDSNRSAAHIPPRAPRRTPPPPRPGPRAATRSPGRAST